MPTTAAVLLLWAWATRGVRAHALAPKAQASAQRCGVRLEMEGRMTWIPWNVDGRMVPEI
jgi:hypothetical protein